MGIFVEGRLAQLGHKIIPLFGARDGRCECRRSSCDAPGKHSPIKWKDAATTDLDTISAWLRQWSNYGVVTERIFAIDIDVRHGGDQTWRSLTTGINISRHVPLTWQVRTGSGGLHIIFKQQPADGIVGTTIDLLRGIDVKGGDRSYIVGPGSIHICGGRYRYLPQLSPRDIPEPATAPEWITKLATQERKRRSPTEWHNLAAAEHCKGTRHKAIAALAGRLLRDPFCDPVLILQLMLGYNRGSCKPPLPDAEVERMCDDFCGGEISKRGK